MIRRFHSAVLALGVAVVGGQCLLFAQAHSAVEDIRNELMELPYYSVFDFLAFKYDKGMVTLMGYAYYPTLKTDAERAVKRASGVDTVQNQIEELPPSPMDDELRWKAYYAIYRDPFLSRYAPGAAMLWGHNHAFGPGFHGMDLRGMPGMEPAGNFPIHIIVKGSRIQLIGVVDNDGDKQIAETKVRQIPGSFQVTNDLQVDQDTH